MLSKKTIVVLVLGVLILSGVFLIQKDSKKVDTVEGATLALSPITSSVVAGSNFNVDIVIDTKGIAIDGVDVFSLRFDPALVEVVQVVPGSLMPVTAAKTFDNKAGTIQFSQLTGGGTTYTGSGKLATLTLKAKSSGSAFLKFDFTAGNSTDTNISSQGVDKLTTVGNGSYQINAK